MNYDQKIIIRNSRFRTLIRRLVLYQMSSHVEQIKSRLGIVDVVSSYLKLQKAGSNYKAPCPFHSEKTPSFFVSLSRESFHCFGCQKSGDIFSFVMEIEGLDFSEALKVLASRAGVEITFSGQEVKGENGILRNILEESDIFFRSQLPKHPQVVEYLKSRGMTGDSAKEFGVGFAPEGWRNLSDHLVSLGKRPEVIEKAGMIIKGPKGWYDRFRTRIMFPVKNSSGQIVGFSGRIFVPIPDVETSVSSVAEACGKYINSPQTPLYDKSRVLYAFDLAKQSIRVNDFCVLMEGQMDVIMSHQAGVKNAVAVSGTALTEHHLEAIKRLSPNLLIAFDADKAGFEASKRGIQLAIAKGFSVKAVVLPAGQDPADIVKQSKEEWQRIVSNPQDFIIFYLNQLAREHEDKQILIKKVRELVIPYLSLIENSMDAAYYVKEIAGRLGLGEDSIWTEVKKNSRRDFNSVAYKDKERDDNSLSKVLFRRYSALLDRLFGFLTFLKNNESEEVRAKVEEIFTKREEDFFSYKNDDNILSRVIFEAEIAYEGMSPAHMIKEIDFLDKEITREQTREELIDAERKIRLAESRGDEEELKTLLQKTGELIKKLNNLSK